MLHLRIHQLVLLTLLTTVAGSAAAQGPPAAGSLFLAPERFYLEDGSLGVAERGLLFSPVVRSKPESGVLAVEVYRFRAASEAPDDAPPLFLLNGGPGYPGLAGRLHDAGFYERRIAPYTTLGDVVVLGQRGIGSSWPNTVCASSGPMAMAGKLCREHWEDSGLDLQGFTVIEAAADVRDAAKALGYERIRLEGGSFGSHWAMAVLRFHPELVERAVLHGLEGPDHTYDSASGLLASLERLAATAESSERLREYIPEGGLIAGFERTLDQARKGPVTVTVDHPTTGEATEMRFALMQVQNMIFGTTRRVGSRRSAPSWPADLIALANGDFTRAALSELASDSGEDDEGPSVEDLRTASFFMLDCSSGITEERLDRLNSDPANRLVGNPSIMYQMACGAWDADLGDDFRTGFSTDIPTAIVHGDWDISTPYDNALELAPSFSRGKLVTVVGGSHGALREAYEEGEGFRDALFTFLRTGDLDVLPEKVVLPEIEWEIP
ncbi:MAG: alpha/beta hydrolase [Acidobacteriota bacterium]